MRTALFIYHASLLINLVSGSRESFDRIIQGYREEVTVVTQLGSLAMRSLERDELPDSEEALLSMARDGPLHDNPLVDRLCSLLPRGDVQRVIGQIRSLVVARWVTKLELLRAEVEREVDELRTADVQEIPNS
jgi:hypothetical protein